MTLVDEQVITARGVVTLEVVAEAGRRLVRFSRQELAAELGVKPIRLGRFIAALLDAGIFDAIEGGILQATGAPIGGGELFLEPIRDEPEPEPEPEPVRPRVPVGRFTKEEARDWATSLGTFTVNQLAKEAEVSWATAKRAIDELVNQRILVEHRDRAEQNTAQYGLRGRVPERRPPQKRKPVEVEFNEKHGDSIHIENRGMAVITQGAPKPSNNKDINALVAIAYAAGWEVIPRAKHWGIKPPVGDIIGVPSTPSSGGVRRFHDELRRAGLPALGDPNQSGPAEVERRGVVVDGTSRAHQRRAAVANRTGTRRPTRRHGKR